MFYTKTLTCHTALHLLADECAEQYNVFEYRLGIIAIGSAALGEISLLSRATNTAKGALLVDEVAIGAKGVMNPNEIHFMQNSIKNTTGKYTVLGNAEALANGSLNPNVLRMNVWKDASGKVWTLDHRRL